MKPTPIPRKVFKEKVIDHREILLRARNDLLRDLDRLADREKEEGLPAGCYADERMGINSKLSAVNMMLYYECGEYF